MKAWPGETDAAPGGKGAPAQDLGRGIRGRQTGTNRKCSGCSASRISGLFSIREAQVVGRPRHGSGRARREWRAANDLYYDLEQAEAGIADEADCLALDPAMAPLVAELEADPYYIQAFDTLPAELAMVELDKLIVSQTHVASRFSEARARGLGPDPDPEALFRFSCRERDLPPVRIQRISSERYLVLRPRPTSGARPWLIDRGRFET